MYTIKYHKRVIKQLNKLPLSMRENIAKRIHSLSGLLGDSLDVKKFENTSRSYRLRVGKIRIIYETDKTNSLILIKKLGYRGDIYKH